MAVTNIRLLANKIEELDPQAQHAVEIAVDSLLDDAGSASSGVVDSRIATLERRVDALADRTRGDEVVSVDKHDRDQSDLLSAIECLMNTSQRTLDELIRADPHAV